MVKYDFLETLLAGIKLVTPELKNYALIDGKYDDMTVGKAKIADTAKALSDGLTADKVEISNDGEIYVPVYGYCYNAEESLRGLSFYLNSYHSNINQISTIKNNVTTIQGNITTMDSRIEDLESAYSLVGTGEFT